MKTKDSLAAALRLVLQKNWLHQEECLHKLQQLAESEIGYVLTEAHRRREQEAAHTVEPFGPVVAAVLAETLCTYMAEQARYWTDDEKVRRQLAALLVLRQYLSANDRNMPRKRVLKYLQDETYLCETWGLTTAEAHRIRAAIENISPKLYSLRLSEGIELLTQAVRRAATFEWTTTMPVEETSEYQVEFFTQWTDEDGGANLDSEVDQIPEELSAVAVNSDFWLRLLRQARQVIIFNEAFAINEAADLTTTAVRVQLALMEARCCIKRVGEFDMVWYSLTEKTWDLLGPDTTLSPEQLSSNQKILIWDQISQPVKVWGQYLGTQLHDNIPKLHPDGYKDIVIGLWLVCVALAITTNRYELYFPVIMVIPLIWETYRKTIKAA